jgi:phage shock protein A
VEIEWLDSLESRVRDAVARLGEMREENGTLRERVEELETRLAAMPVITLPPAPAEEEPEGDMDAETAALRAHVRALEANLAAAETERAEAAAAARSWEVEREEVRRRVEALTGRLEGLVEG